MYGVACMKGKFRVFMSIVALMVLAAGPAAGADPADPDALIARGLELRRAGKDREALPLFRQAAEEKRTPRAVAQVGLCELALGLWVEGEDHLQQAVTNKTDPWIRKNERQLKEALENIQGRLGFLDVWGDPAGAKVAVDGHAMGTLPLERPLRLTTGQHSLVIESAGFVTDSRLVQVSVGAVTREHAALAPVAVAVVPAAPPPALPPAEPAKQATLVTKPAESTEGEPAASPIYTRWWFWTAIGVVAVAAGGTAYLLLSRKDNCDSTGGGSCVTW
jgi:hypothetical protein